MISPAHAHRCGYVAIIGRPNVGKSTLLNHLIRFKVSITSRRPQTTRHTILGVHSLPGAQIVYVDTPGIHGDARSPMNRYMNRAARSVINEVDAILFVVDALHWTEADQTVLDSFVTLDTPKFLVVNKTDLIHPKERLLPWLSEVGGYAEFQEIVPVSALKSEYLDVLEQKLITVLPEGEPLFSDDQLTDRSERFLAAEIVREKLTRSLGQEIPYALTVGIERFETKQSIVHIGAVIWVERKGQKAIVIGKGGSNLKKVGKSAREDIEKLLGYRVNLELWVKVKEGWSRDEKAIQSLGYQIPER